MAILPMVNTIRTYEWGSHTEIPRLTGIENRGGEPMAELWMGAHPGAPSRVRDDDELVSLEEYLAREPGRRLGAVVSDRFAGRLPFLFKILSAARPLSIQAHPSLQQAREGFRNEEEARIPREAFNRSYRDDNHKPELIRAVTEFWALRGFRSYDDIAFELRGEEFAFLRESALSLERDPGPASLEQLFVSLMSTPPEQVAEAARTRADAQLTDLGPEDEYRMRARYEWIVRLHDVFGDDPGVAAPLYLNLVRLEPGEAMYLPAGTLHAYLSGTGVEIMANSDNVIRGGLTRKHVDVDELTRTLVFEPDAPVRQRAPDDRAGVWHRFDTPASEFVLDELVLDGAADRMRIAESPEIVLVLDGEIRLSESDGDARRGAVDEDTGGATAVDRSAAHVRLAAGASAFVTADSPSYRLEGSGQVFVASVPIDTSGGAG